MSENRKSQTIVFTDKDYVCDVVKILILGESKDTQKCTDFKAINNKRLNIWHKFGKSTTQTEFQFAVRE